MSSVLKSIETDESMQNSKDKSIKEWQTVCRLDDLTPDIGARALIEDDQVAIFRISGADDVYAIDAFDPFSEAAVLSRGIVGDINSELVVASPIYKQHFNLQTGQCIEDPTVKLKTYPVRVQDGMVQLAVYE